MIKPKHLRSIILLGIWILLPAGDLLAQAGGFTGSFSRIGFAPRGMAMGNSLTAVHHEGAYTYYNPALTAAPSDYIQLDFSTSAMRFDRQLHMVSGHFQLPPSAGISVAIINGRIGDIDGRTQSGYSTEIFSVNEYQLLTNFGIRFSETMWGGIGIKFNRSDYHSDVSSSTGIGVDAGLYKKFGRASIGLAVQDLFAETNYDTSNLFGSNTGGSNSHTFPTRFKLGISYEAMEDLLLSTDYEVQVQTSEIIETGTELINGRPVTTENRRDVTSNTQIFRFGARHHLHPRFTLRAGFQAFDLNHDINIQPTAGFSLHLPFDTFSPSIDYAFLREPSKISTMHVFSIRLEI